MNAFSKLAIGFATVAAVTVGTYQAFKIKTPEECAADAGAARANAVDQILKNNSVGKAASNWLQATGEQGKCTAEYFIDDGKKVELKAFGKTFAIRLP